MKKKLPNSLLMSLFTAKTVMIFCFLSFISTSVFSQALVQTDKPDYPPGSTVYITGSGFTANETVTLQVLHLGSTDDDNTTSTAHQPWTITADNGGNINTTWLVPLDQDEAGATLQLTAVGAISGLTAQVTFTDAAPLPALAYPASNIFVVGKPVTLTPNNPGGNSTAASISPSITTLGLSIDKFGTISGTPNAVSANTLYTVTASNAGGTQTPSPTLHIQIVQPPIISYSSPNTFVVGASVNLTPTSTGSSVDNYSVSPALPLGLSINATSGAITGSPTTVTATKTYTVTATNTSSGGTGTFPISITITPALPNITYPTPDVYVYATGISSLTPNNTGGAAASYSISPSLTASTGLSFSTSTGVISGTPTKAAVAADYTVTATNATGIGTFVINITVNKRPLNVTVANGNYNKPYDGTTAATVNLNSDKLNPDKVTLTSTANFVDKNVATNKTINITNIAISGGADAGNYILVNTTASTTANITAVPLTITADNKAMLFGAALPILTVSYSGFVPGETNASLTTQPTLTTTGTSSSPVGTYPITASGAVDGNYTIGYVAGTLTINPLAPVITYTTPNVFIVGTAISALNPNNTGGAATYSVNPALPGGLSIDPNTGVITGTPTTVTAAADYIVTAANVTGSVTFTVNIKVNPALPAPIITYNTPNTFVYGTAITALTPNNTGGAVAGYSVNPALPAGLSIDPNSGAITGTPTAATLVADYTVTATNLTGNGTFVISIVVNQAPLTITANNRSKVYGSPQSLGTTEFTTTPTQLYNSDGVSGVTLTSTGSAAATSVGTYDIVPSAATGTGLSNYNISYVNGHDTVKVAPLTITADNQSKIYGSTQSLGTIAFKTTPTPLYNSDVVSGVTLTSTGSTAATSVGTYDIVPSAATGTGLSNYSISYVNGHDTVKVAPLTITANNQSKIYGSTQSLGTIAFKTTPTPLYNSDVVSGVTLTSTGSTAATSVGTYDIVPSAATGTGLSNYSISYVNGHDTVKVAPLTITANNQSKIYGSTQSLGTIAFKTTPTPLYNGDMVSGVTLTSTGSAVVTTVGTYDIVPSAAAGTGLSNYNISYVNGHDTVKVAPLTITADNQSKIYGSTQSLGTIAFKTTPTPLYNSDVVSGVTLTSTGSAAAATVGTYDIVPSAATGTGLSNYSISYVNGHDTVKVAPLTITANNQSKIYGSAQNLGTSAFETTTLYNGNTVSGVTLTSTGSAAATTVGTYDIVPSAATGAGLSNYNISYVNGHDTVKVAPLTITANNQSKIYGSTQSLGTIAFTTIPTPLYNSDVVSGVTLTSTGSTAATSVGTYDIVPSAATGTGLSNYSISYVNGHDTVKVAPLTITANNQSKIYGSTQSLGTIAFKTTPTPLYNGDMVSGVTLTSTGSAVVTTVGTYDIVPSAAAGTGLSNYNISYVNGHDTVKVAPLTITANNQCKVYGSTQTLGTIAFKTIPTPLYNSDVVNGVTLTSTGSAGTAIVGTYDIVPSAATGTGLSNYSISYVNGHDTVKVAPLTITANNQSKIYGSTQSLGTIAFKTIPTPLYNSDVVSGVTLTSTGSAGTAIVGTYDIVPSAATGTGLSNYRISYVNGHDTVKVAPLTITAKDQTKVYSTLFTFAGTEFTPSTLYNGDKVNSVNLASAGAAASATATGSPYVITPSAAIGTGLSNYKITYVNGSMTVTPLDDCTLYAYNGTMFANTDVSLTSTTVNLSIVVTTTGSADASTAKVNFYNTTGATPVLIGAGTVTTINFNQAIYSYPLKIDIGNNLSVTNQISWTIGGNYSNTGCAETSTDVTVSTRTTDFVTGGGYVVMGAGGYASAGTYAGGPNTKTNFGYNVKWNKTLTNIQGGGFNAIVRNGTKTYHIKANKVLTLVVTPRTTTNAATAAFTSGNATINDAVTGVTLVGNCNLTVEITDSCEPGAGSKSSGDQIAITLKDAKGVLLYSNNWNATKTAQQSLGGGNLQVQSAANTAAPICSGNTNTLASLKNDMVHNGISVINNNLTPKDTGNPLNVRVYPNPSISNFNLQTGGGTDEKVEIKVTDVLGHLIGNYKVTSGSTMTVGDNLRPGIYIVQVKQGQTYKYYRILKQ